MQSLTLKSRLLLPLSRKLLLSARLTALKPALTSPLSQRKQVAAGALAQFFDQPRAIVARTTTQAGFQTARDMAKAIVDSSDFDKLRDEMTAEDELREAVIKRSRDLQKLSKQAIFSLHRQDFKQADERLSKADVILQELQKKVDGEEAGRYGALSSATEEYAEAVIFRAFFKEGRLLPSHEIGAASRDEYLGGVLDFTGELNRYAIARATVRDVPEVCRCRDLVDALLGNFLQFDLRSGSLRKKFDALKYTLRKLENTKYELSLAESGYKRKDREDSDDEQGQAAAGNEQAS